MLDSLAQLENFTHGEAATDEALTEFEEFFGGPLPALYREFLQKYGCAVWFGAQLYGTGAGLPRFDAVAATNAARESYIESSFKPLPEKGCVVTRYDGGGWYWLFPEGNEFPNAVQLFETSQFGSAVESWTTFEEYLKYWISISTGA